MGSYITSGLKILIVILALLTGVVFVLAMWRPDVHIEYGARVTRFDLLIARLMITAIAGVAVVILATAWRGRVWCWYLLAVLFVYDLIARILTHDVPILNLILDVWAIYVLLAAIYNRRVYDACMRSRQGES